MIVPLSKSHLLHFILLMSTVFISPGTAGSTVHDVNVVAIQVDNQTERARESALRAAFQQVVVKMSGDSKKFNSGLLRGYSANDYLKAYQYEVEDSQLAYVATFDTARIQQLLKSLNLPIWEARRPDTLLWVTTDIEAQFSGAIWAENDSNPMMSIVDRVSRQRGVDIILPIMDIEDSATVTAYDVWGRFMNPILNASKRYNIDHVVAARIRATPEYDESELKQRISEQRDAQLARFQAPQSSPASIEQTDVEQRLTLAYPSLEADKNLSEDVLYSAIEDPEVIPEPLFSLDEFRKLLNALQPFQLDYTFFIDGESKSGTLAAASPEQLLSEMLSLYVDELSQRYAVQLGFTTEPQVIRLQVNNVDSLQKYSQITQFLSTLTLVDSVILIEQVGSTAQFQINLLTDRERLIETLLLDGRLMPLVNDFGEVIDDTQFFWGQ